MALPYIKVYKDFLEIAEALDTGARGRLFLSILQYANGIEPTELTGAERIAYLMVKGQIDRDSVRSEEISISRSEAGKKGAAAKWQTDGKNSNCHLPYGKNGNRINNDKDNDKDNDDIVDNEKEVASKKVKKESKKNPLGDPALAECCSCYESNVGTISLTVSELLQEWLTKVEPSLICAAIGEAAKHNARTWSYIEAVLKNSYGEGITTAEAFAAKATGKGGKKGDAWEAFG